MEIARVPSALEVEEAFLCSLMQSPNLIDSVLYIGSENFESELHSEIWHTIKEFRGRNESVTLPALVASKPTLKKEIVRIYTNGFLVPFNIVDYARTIRDRSLRRRLVEHIETLAELAADLDTPTEEIVAQSMTKMARIAADGIDRSRTKVQVARTIQKQITKPAVIYPTGIEGLDKAMGGGIFQGFMYGLAARKKAGKTVLLGGISHYMNSQGVPHVFLALETPPTMIEQRNIARESRFNSIRFLKRDDLTLPAHVEEYANSQQDNTIYEYAPGIGFDQMRALISRHVSRRKIRGVFIDYLQLIRGQKKGETEEQHLRNVSQWLADFGRQENIFIVIAAQTNQDGNTRGGEGLRLACDQYYTLHRDDATDDGAWLEMGESRYTFYANVGSSTLPGLTLEKHGPYFRDAG